jgi:hypothetical protein
MEMVARYSTRHEAELAAGFLRNAGVDAIVQSDDASGWEPGLTFAGSAWISVPETDATRALEILQDLDVTQEPADTKATPFVGWLIVVLLVIPSLVVVGQIAVWAVSQIGLVEPPAATPDMRAIVVAAILATVVVALLYRRYRRRGGA